MSENNEEQIVEQEVPEVVEPTAEELQAQAEIAELQSLDIVVLINEYLKDKQRDFENDSLNVVDGLIYSWEFTHVAKPSNAELLALKEVAFAKVDQEEINRQALRYLAETDYHCLKQIETGVPMSEEVKQLRQAARDSIVRE